MEDTTITSEVGEESNPWLGMEVHIGREETSSLSTHREAGSSLYQVECAAFLSPLSDAEEMSEQPTVHSCCIDDLLYVAVEHDIYVFEKCGQENVTSLTLEDIGGCRIEVMACHARYDRFLVSGDENGFLWMVDRQDQSRMVGKRLVQKQDEDSRVFESMKFSTTPHGDVELIIVFTNGRVCRIPQIDIVLASEDTETLEAMFPKLTKQIVDTSSHHSIATISASSIPILGPDVILTMGQGDCMLCLWDLEVSKSAPVESLPSPLEDDVGVKKCEICSDSLFCFIQDENDELTLWDVSSFTMRKRWNNQLISDFMIVEMGTSSPRQSLNSIRLALLSVSESGSKCLSICQLPNLEPLYSIVVDSFTHLIPAPPDQRAIFFVEGGDDHIIRVQSLTEGDPQSRFHSLLNKNLFEAAENLAKSYELDMEALYQHKATWLLNCLAPWTIDKLTKDRNEVFIELIDCLKQAKDDVFVSQCSLKAYMPSFSQNLQLLNMAEQRLTQNKSADDDKNIERRPLLTAVLEAKHRLATYEVVFDISTFTGSGWHRFRDVSMTEEFLSWLRAADFDKAFAIWTRHQSDFEVDLSIAVIEDLLHSIPETTSTDILSPWLADSFIPFVIRTIPDALPQVARWLEQRARSMEIQEKFGWPQNALSLCELLLNTCSSYSSSGVSGVSTPKEYATQMCSLSLASSETPQGEEQSTDAFVQLHTLITHLRGLLDLHTRYNCKLRLAEYIQETTESLTYRILDHVVAVELIPETIDDVVRPFMREHNLNEEKTLYQYIGDLISECTSDAAYGTEALWEAKAIAVIHCIQDEQYKCQAIVEAMQRAYIPWSADMQALVDDGLKLKVPSVKVLEAQVPFIKLRHLLIKYGCRQFDVSSLACARQLLQFIVRQNSSESVMEDALVVVGMFKYLQPYQAYYHRIIYLLQEQDQYDESIALLDSMEDKKMVLKVCKEVISYAVKSLSHRPRRMAIAASDIRLTLYACRLLKYTQLREQDVLALDEMSALYHRLYNYYKLINDFGVDMNFGDFGCKERRLAALLKKMREFDGHPKNTPFVLESVTSGMHEKRGHRVWNEAERYRLAELLLIPRDSLKGEQAIMEAETGDHERAVNLAQELYSLNRSHSTGEVLYRVAKTLCCKQTVSSPSLASHICHLADQAIAICRPDLLLDCLELSKQARRAHNVLLQSECGDKMWEKQKPQVITKVLKTYVESGEGCSEPLEQTTLLQTLEDPCPTSKDSFRTWSFDDFYKEDGLVMPSDKALAMTYQYASCRIQNEEEDKVKNIDAEPGKPAEPDPPYNEENKENQPQLANNVSTTISDTPVLIPRFVAAGDTMIQFLKENSHSQLALHCALDMLAGTLQKGVKDGILCEVGEGSTLTARQQKMAQIVQLSRPVIIELTRMLLKKILSQSIVDAQLALGYLTMLPTPDALQLLHKMVKGAGSKYKKVLQLARIGKAYAELCQQPNIVDKFDEVLTDAEWGKRLGKLKICFKEVYLASKKSKLMEQLVRCDSVDVETIKDFCSTYECDSTTAILQYLEHLLVDAPSLSSVDNIQGLLQKAEQAVQAIERFASKDALATHLTTLLHKMDPYDYERLLFVYNQFNGQAVNMDVDVDKIRMLLIYLQSYERVAPPTKYEREFRPISEEDEMLNGSQRLSPKSSTRLPFHPFITGDPWKIISPELNAENVSVWIPIASSRGLSLDQLYLTTIQNMILAYTENIKNQQGGGGDPANSGDGGAPIDKSKCDWSEEEEGENRRVLTTMKGLIMKVSDMELAMACCNWATKTLPLGTEKVLALKAAVVLSEKWTNACPDNEKAMESYKRFRDYWKRLSTEQVLFQHQLGDPSLVALSGSPAKLIFKLYEHPSIQQRLDCQGSLLDTLPDIHAVANKLAIINKTNVDKIRLKLVQDWLPSTLTNKLYDGDMTMNMTMEMNMLETTIRSEEEIQEDEINLRRVIYILQQSVEKGVLFLLNFASAKVSANITNMCRVRAFRCVFSLVDQETVQKVAKKSLAEIKEYIQTLLYLVELDRLHIPHTEVTFMQCNKEGLVRGIWRNHSHEKRAVRLVANICLDYKINDVQLWDNILQQLKAFDMVEQLRHVLVRLSGVSSLWQVECIQSMWKAILMQPFETAVCPLNEEELTACFEAVTLLHSCPLLLDLELELFIAQLLRLELLGLAAGVALLLPDDQQRADNLHKILKDDEDKDQPKAEGEKDSDGTKKCQVLETLTQLADWTEQGRSVPLYTQTVSAVHDYVMEHQLYMRVLDTTHWTDFLPHALLSPTLGELVVALVKANRNADAIDVVTQFKETDSDFAQAAEENNLEEEYLLMAYLCHEQLYGDDVAEFLPEMVDTEESDTEENKLSDDEDDQGNDSSAFMID